jgi:hypothetical protein
VFSKLQKAKDWLKPWSNAIVDCLYAALADDAERHLNEARAAIESTSELNADDKDVCRLQRTSELWHTVANWSYHRRDRNTLGQAFEFFTVNADGWLSDYTWQHVNCMYQLVSGKAKRIDVTELLKRVTLTPQMDNFNKHIWPMVIELGLADDDLEQTRQQLTERIERDGKHVPRKEARTKTAIRHL